jgi:tetratricopeptide (TPR) repeat protein
MEPTRSPQDLERCLAGLQEIEIIHRTRQSPEVEYAFTHALTRDAIYASILRQVRRQLHARVGLVIEGLFAGRIEEFYGLLAYHYAQAESWDKARRYLLLSGDQAERIAADAESLASYQQAMAVITRAFGGKWDPLEQAIVTRKMGEALARRGEHSLALEHLMQAFSHLQRPFPATRAGRRLAIVREALVQLGRRTGPRSHRDRSPGRADAADRGARGKRDGMPEEPAVRQEAEAYESVAWVLATYDPELALLSVLRLVNTSQRAGFVPGLMAGYAFLSYFADAASLKRLSSSYARRVLSLLQGMPVSGEVGLPYAFLAIHENARARWSGVREYARRAIAAYQQGGHWNIRGWRLAIVDYADAAVHEGRFGEALAHAQDLVRLGQESGDRVVLAWGLARQGFALRGLGKLGDAVDSLEGARERLKSIPDYHVYVDCSGELGQCHLRLGDLRRALTVFEECRGLRVEHGMMRSPMCTRFINGMAEACLLLAEQEDGAARSAWLGKAGTACAEALRQGRAYLPGMPEAMMLRGRYEWMRGRRAHAARWWHRSEELADHTGVRYDLARTLFEIGIRSGDRGRLRRARDLFAEMGSQWDLSRVEETA